MKLRFLFTPQCFSSSPPAFSHCDTRILLFPTKDAARVFGSRLFFWYPEAPEKATSNHICLSLKLNIHDLTSNQSGDKQLEVSVT